MSALPDGEALEKLIQHPQWAVYVGLFFLALAVIYNFEKLAEPLGKRRRWETEKSRIEANQKYWELHAQKERDGVADLDDPFLPAGQAKARQDAAANNFYLSFRQRLVYGSIGGYLGFATLLLLSMASQPPATPLKSYEGIPFIIAIAILGVLTGIFTALQKSIPNQHLRLVVAGAFNTLPLTFGLGILFLVVLALTNT